MSRPHIGLIEALAIIAGPLPPTVSDPADLVPTPEVSFPPPLPAERVQPATAASLRAQDVLLRALRAGRVKAWGEGVASPDAPLHPDGQREPIPAAWWHDPDVVLVPTLTGAFLTPGPGRPEGGKRPGWRRVVLDAPGIEALAHRPDVADLAAQMRAAAEAHVAAHGVPPKKSALLEMPAFAGKGRAARAAYAALPDHLRRWRGRPRDASKRADALPEK